MIRVRAVLVASVGWAFSLALAGTALAGPPIGDADARHLLARAGFDAAPAELAAYAALDRGTAIERLVSVTRTRPASTPPALADEGPVPPARFATLTLEERQDENRRERERGQRLRAWWLREMATTDAPLLERMTLFWHNHFVSAQPKVRWSHLMLAQNERLRAHALGNFAALLRDVLRDPAMLIYLDAVASRRGQPNENLARELMELFTLGEGHYGERDVKEAARALTGYGIDPRTAAFSFRPAWHDDGEKTILGRTGPLDADGLAALLLEQPATAEFVVRKLWREFVSPDPDASRVATLAAGFRASSYEIRPLVRALLAEEAFWAASNRGALTKSPVDVTVGTLRRLAIDPADWRPVATACASMGQNLFAAPNVRGWPGGDAWITSATLLQRKQFLARVAGQAAETAGADAGRAASPFARTDALRAVLLDPAYQVK